MTLRQAPTLEQTKRLLLIFVKGLKHNNETGDYTFRQNNYRLRGIKEGDEDNSYCYFINLTDPTVIKYVQVRKGVPYFDGFNNVKINTALYKKYVKKLYQQDYYKQVTHVKRRIIQEEKKAAAIPKVKKAKAKRERVKHDPIKCAFCGEEFTPKSSTQRFCCNACRRRFWSRQEAQKVKAGLRSEKVCPVCGKEFIGTPRNKYCSKECYRISQKKYSKNRAKNKAKQLTKKKKHGTI